MDGMFFVFMRRRGADACVSVGLARRLCRLLSLLPHLLRRQGTLLSPSPSPFLTNPHPPYRLQTFYFIRPTPSNLSSYERWSSTELQDQVWLGDMCDEVFKVDLKSGDTMIIPTGWIHAVYTPVDTLVFGGNFLHSYNIQTREFHISLDFFWGC